MIQGNEKYPIKGTDIQLKRIGFGSMRLSGPGIWGPPKDEHEAIAVLRTAVDLGVNHIDTADFYGPHITNQIIRKALFPYPTDLTIVTKVGYKRTANKDWVPALSDEELISAIHDNLRNLDLKTLQIVNLRLSRNDGPDSTTLERALKVLLNLKKKGLIQNVGVSNVTPEQYAHAAKITSIVCVQNEYNIVSRQDDLFIDVLDKASVAYVPYFPLGGFQPIQSQILGDIARQLNATPMQVAIAWLLQHSKNILAIPGTSSVTHLRENLQAATLVLPPESLDQLNKLASEEK